MILRTFGWSLGITVVGLLTALLLGGPRALLLVLVLSVLEVSLSFDNAVVNATVLERMSPFWRTMFLTVGIAVAVFGMRLLFPLLVVGLTAHMNPAQTIDLALNQGAEYGHRLEQAHPAIASFGGMFLLMLFLDFVFTQREYTWLSWLERPLARAGRLATLPVIAATGTLIGVAETMAGPNTERVFLSGLLGMVVYLLVNGLSQLFEHAGKHHDEELVGINGTADQGGGETASGAGRYTRVRTVSGRAGFFLFLYLEVLDASFSFDGVVGAFAITSDIFIIAAGLGIGAMYIRSLTVFLVRKGTLRQYVYLEHGAHWAIGALAVLLFVSLEHQIPEVVTGLIGVAFIGASMLSSISRNRGWTRRHTW